MSGGSSNVATDFFLLPSSSTAARAIILIGEVRHVRTVRVVMVACFTVRTAGCGCCCGCIDKNSSNKPTALIKRLPNRCLWCAGPTPFTVARDKS